MKKCNSCGADIPNSAAYCDICGALCSKSKVVLSKEEQKERKRKKERRRKIRRRILLGIGGFFLFLIVISVIDTYVSMKRYEREDRLRDLSGWEVTVTPEEFEKVDIGMTYEEVRDIIGGDGKKIEDDKYRVTYSWPGEYYINRYHGLLEISFNKHHYDSDTNVPTVDIINEDEIVDGREAYETFKIMEEFRFEELDTPIVTQEQVSKITEGMSYEKVCEILQSEGRIYESSTWMTSSNMDKITTYVWRCKHDGRDYYFELDFYDGIIKYLYEWRIEGVD